MGFQAPAPVAFGAAWHVHACRGVESQDVLHRNYGDIGDGGLNCLDKGPMDGLAVQLKITFHALHGVAVRFASAILGSVLQLAPPSDGGVVIMGAGEADLMRDVMRWAVSTFLVEAELEHGHAGEAAALAEFFHAGRDSSEVLRHYLERT